MASSLPAQRVKVESLRTAVYTAKTPAEATAVQEALAVEAGKLQQLITGSAAVAVQGESALEAVPPTIVKARVLALRAKIKELTAKLKEAKGMRAVLIQHQIRHLVLRLRYLAKGKDIEQVMILHPGNVSVYRQRIGLPAVFKLPGRNVVVLVIGGMARVIARQPNESNKAFRTRLRSLAKRALARYVKKIAEGRLEGSAVNEAITETAALDVEAVNAETHAGGVASDGEADLFDASIDEALPELAQASALVPEPTLAPGGAVSIGDVDRLLIDAQALEAEMALQSESDDEFFSDDTDFSVAEESKPAMSTEVKIAIGVGIAFGAWLLFGNRK